MLGLSLPVGLWSLFRQLFTRVPFSPAAEARLAEVFEVWSCLSRRRRRSRHVGTRHVCKWSREQLGGCW